jgi:hypothetical protein
MLHQVKHSLVLATTTNLLLTETRSLPPAVLTGHVSYTVVTGLLVICMSSLLGGGLADETGSLG